MGQVTITGVPSNIPWASSPQVPGVEATTSREYVIGEVDILTYAYYASPVTR